MVLSSPSPRIISLGSHTLCYHDHLKALEVDHHLLGFSPFQYRILVLLASGSAISISTLALALYGCEADLKPRRTWLNLYEEHATDYKR